MGYPPYEIASGTLALLFDTISIISTVATLILIRDMKRWNAYMLLIFNLTLCQFFYDLALFFLPFYNTPACVMILIFLTTFAGTATSLWTNVISYILYSIVQNLHSFDVYGYFKIFFPSIMIPSIALAILDVVFYDNSFIYNILKNFYYWLRIGSIVFNIAVHGLISFKLSRMGFSEGSKRQDPVRVLASRLKYYPIVQVITRAGAAWYEAVYGFDTKTFDDKMDATQQTSLYFYAICVPSAGLGYFLVFLLVQPRALALLKRRLREYWCFRQCIAEVPEVPDPVDKQGHETTAVDAENRNNSRVESTVSSSYKGSTDLLNHMSSMDSTMLLSLLDDLDEDELAERIDIKYSHLNNSSLPPVHVNASPTLPVVVSPLVSSTTGSAAVETRDSSHVDMSRDSHASRLSHASHRESHLSQIDIAQRESRYKSEAEEVRLPKELSGDFQL